MFHAEIELNLLVLNAVIVIVAIGGESKLKRLN